MNDRVPFTRSRWAIFCTMVTTIAGIYAANHLTAGRTEDELVDLGCWIILFGQLFGLLMIFRSQRLMNRDNTIRLARVENRVMGAEAVAPFFLCDEGCDCAKPSPRRFRRTLEAVPDDGA